MSNIIGTGFNAASCDGEIASLEADLHALADIGCDTVELGITTVDFISGGRVIESRAKQLVSMLKQFPFRYTVHGLVSSNFMDKATQIYQVDAAKALVEFCDRIDARILVQHSGELRAEQISERTDADSREREALVELGDFAKRYGVRIALENIFTTEPGQYRQTPAEVAHTVKALNHPNIVALIDFSHAYIECAYRGFDFFEQISAMAPVAGHLHVHDSFGRPQGFFHGYHPQENTMLGIGDLHLPLGWGDIAWERIFSELTFLPGTVLMMEIGARYRLEQPDCLARARKLIDINNNRLALAAE